MSTNLRDEQEQISDDESSAGMRSKLRRNGGANEHVKVDGRGLFYKNLSTLFFQEIGNSDYKKFGGRKLAMRKVNRCPPIYIVDDFLNAKELQYFEKIVNDGDFAPSLVDRTVTCSEKDGAVRLETVSDTAHRNSTVHCFRKRENATVTFFEQRVADLFGCDVGQLESLQLQRYEPGGYFKIHHDLALEVYDHWDVSNDWRVRRTNGKRRIVSLLFYLNTLEEAEGGCTHFPLCRDLRIQPKKGSVLMWCNVTKNGTADPRVIHEAEVVCPSTKNPDVMKCGLNLWICEV